MHENTPPDKYLQWVLAEQLANQAAADFLDGAVWPETSVPEHLPSKEVVAVLRARANACFKAAMAELDVRAQIASRKAAAANKGVAFSRDQQSFRASRPDGLASG